MELSHVPREIDSFAAFMGVQYFLVEESARLGNSCPRAIIQGYHASLSFLCVCVFFVLFCLCCVVLARVPRRHVLTRARTMLLTCNAAGSAFVDVVAATHGRFSR